MTTVPNILYLFKLNYEFCVVLLVPKISISHIDDSHSSLQLSSTFALVNTFVPKVMRHTLNPYKLIYVWYFVCSFLLMHTNMRGLAMMKLLTQITGFNNIFVFVLCPTARAAPLQWEGQIVAQTMNISSFNQQHGYE